MKKKSANKKERTYLGDKTKPLSLKTKSHDKIQYYNVSDVGNVLLDNSRIDKFWSGTKFNSNRFSNISKDDLPNLIDSKIIAYRFKLVSLTFGNWLSYEDRVEFLIGLADALYLLHEAIYPNNSFYWVGQEILSISLGGRGRGGRALAHYEPGTNFINLTKPYIGSGALFHEYAHFVDRNLAKRLKLQDYFVSGGDSTRKKVDDDRMNSNIKLVRLFEELFKILYWESDNKPTKFQANLKGKSDYYNSRNEVFARTCEVYMALKTKKPNKILTGLKHDNDVYPSKDLVSKCVPILDQIFHSFTISRL